MTYRKKSWQEKMMDKNNFPKIQNLKSNFPCYKSMVKMGAREEDKIVLANPSEVLEIMNNVPKGRLITIHEICEKLARKHKVKGCCTLTTGIFIMTIANAAEEMKREGKESKTPYWRTLKGDGFLNEKFPGGLERHKKLLEREGFTVLSKGKKYFVKNYENFIFSG